MQKQMTYKQPLLKLKKSNVGRLLIAVYVVVVLTLSATAKAENKSFLLENRTQISN